MTSYLSSQDLSQFHGFTCLTSWNMNTGCMTKCRNLAGSSRWVAVQMVEATTTTHTQSYEVVTELCQWIYMFLDVRQLPKLCFMVCCSCRRRSIGGRIFFTGGPNKKITVGKSLSSKVSTLSMLCDMLWVCQLNKYSERRCQIVNDQPEIEIFWICLYLMNYMMLLSLQCFCW